MCIIAWQPCLSQDANSTYNNIENFPDKFLTALNKKTSRLDKQLSKQTEKYIHRLQRNEEKLKHNLYRVDSNATKNLFLLNTNEQYSAFLSKIKTDSIYDSNKMTGEYIPGLDTLHGSLSFLSSNPQFLNSSKGLSADLQGSLAKLNRMEAKLQDAEQVKQFIRQRKEQIKKYLLQFAHLPHNISSIYNDYNKDLYYYGSQLSTVKEELNDPDKLIKKALSILQNFQAFRSFMEQNSVLASLFPGQGNYGTPQAIAGLQTRDQVYQMIQTQLSSANSMGAFTQNFENAQSQLDHLKDRLIHYGKEGSDVDIPDFKPNTQKTKKVISRLEYGTNVQTQRSNYLFPVTTDFGLSMGYKLNDKSIVGVGASYKVGWGADINHINLSSQGASIRSYMDVKIKGSFYASAGLEYNYQHPFDSIGVVKNMRNWKESGLVGISKIISLKTKFFKKTKVQLLWDFLNYKEPGTEPLKFRVGYSF